MSSVVQPVPFGDQPAAPIDRFVPGSRCRIVVFDMGDQVLRVGVDPELTVPFVLERALDRLTASSNGLAMRASSLDEADWLVRRMGDQLVLAPASGWRLDPADAGRRDQAETRFVLGPAGGGEAAAAALGGMLWRISRARNLIQPSGSPAMSDADVLLSVEMIRYRNPKDPGSVMSGVEPLHPGEQVAFRIRNPGRLAVDVTLLHVDAHYKIEAVFPLADREADNRLISGAVQTTGRFDVTDSSLGREQVVAIGVLPQGARVDFRALEQPALAVADETRRGVLTRGVGTSTPLQRLFDRAMFGAGQTRGLTRAEARACAIRLLTWRTERQPIQ